MSASNQTAGPSRSSDQFAVIFQTALSEYENITGNPLHAHPFAIQLDGCDSPVAVLNVLRIQAQALSRSRKHNERLMAWLGPTVHILFTSSATLGEGIGLPFSPAKTIFTGMGVLLAAARDVVADQSKLIHLFEMIHSFVQRLSSYTRVPLTTEFTELLGKIMGQILSILALSTKEITERRMKKFLKRLIGKSGVEDALLRLDSLTKEESLMAVVKNLEVAHHIKTVAEDIDDKVRAIDRVDQNVAAVKERSDEQQRNQMQEKFHRWLSPPDCSTNHNVACKTRHDGTGMWFIHCSKFREWKKNGSLLWISGNPGAGKSVLWYAKCHRYCDAKFISLISSAIIENIKTIREETSALVAYHFFDYKDSSKRHVRGLLASLLSQLSGDSNRCRDVLCQLYDNCRNGSEQPSEITLAECLNAMIKIVGQLPVFIIIDALDECPNTTGTPSARDEVLHFVRDLLGSNHSNLFLSITSRPEQDIQNVLDPLTSVSSRVVIHEESGQREDINLYVRSFVYTNNSMRRWRDEDKELVIDTLSERASGMFRWVFCQLDTLRRCFPPSIQRTLTELPTTLDETYERTLEGIPKEKRQYAHRLFQCLVAAIRPLRTEELGEIFAIKFDQDTGGYLMEGWRPENPEEDIRSACSTLISIIDDDEGSRIVQFSHFSVKEYLTSVRLRTSELGNIHHFHIPLDAAHTTLAQASLTVLLQLGEKADKQRLATLSLAFYAAQHWFVHAKYGDVAPRIQDVMEKLFNPSSLYLAAWVWVYDVDWVRSCNQLSRKVPDRPSHPNGTALYYAASCGLCGPAKYLISVHGEDVNVKCGTYGSPLHVASRNGYLDAVSLLLDHGADVNMTNRRERTPLHEAYTGSHLEVMRLLLERGASPDVQSGVIGLLTHYASFEGQAEAIRLLLQYNADVNARDERNYTPLHRASSYGHTEVVQILLEHGADINAVAHPGTPLWEASHNGHLAVVQLLLKHGADKNIATPGSITPFVIATFQGHTQVAQLLMEHGGHKK